MQEYDLRIFLGQFRDTTVDFFRFNGNYGDSLIWHGTMNLFAELNICVVNVDISTAPRNRTLIIDGGGNFVDYYDDVRNFLKAKHALYTEIVILPHTIFGFAQIEVLQALGNNTTIFCREEESARFVNSFAPDCRLYLWHACAFYNPLVQYPAKGTKTLNAFRSDKESTREALPWRNRDISRKGNATKPLNKFINKIKKYDRVNTDRLHVAIAATLLGKQVSLYPNSYYKNKAVYEYTLKKFPNINFIE